MSAWDELRPAIHVGRQERVTGRLLAMSPQERREVADELPGYLKARRAESGWIDGGMALTLLLAGAATISGPAAAVTWVCRSDMRGWGSAETGRRMAGFVSALLVHRTPQWRAEFRDRLAERLRPPSASSRDQVHWHIVARLCLDAGDPPPSSDAFVAGWVEWGADRARLGEDPFLETLVPRMFEADGVGALLQWEPSGRPGSDAWAPSLVRLSRQGRLRREMLLDGCVSRFLRGGRVNELRWFVALHDLLEPTVEESSARLRDHLRLLPAAPGPVADLALREVRRVDDAAPLEEEAFAEAAEALLFRPEKKLVRATLIWLGQTARRRNRVDATLTAVTAGFASEDLDLRERAVKVAVKHAPKAGEDARRVVRDAAVDLPADLRAAVAESCGAVEEAAAGPLPVPGPPPFTPRPRPAPIGSPAELAEELVAQFRDHAVPGLERLLGAMVEHARRDREATREALRRIAPETVPWALDEQTDLAGDHPHSWAAAGVRAVVSPDYRHPASASMSAFLHDRPEPGRDHRYHREEPVMHRFLAWRLNAAVQAVGRVPVLLATPTEASGHVAPATLVTRMTLLEEAGAEPDPADLHQALLRIPRDIDSGAVARAQALASPAGKTLAAWLAAGGLPDPAVTCAPVRAAKSVVRGYPHYGYTYEPATRVLPSVTVQEDAPHIIARLCTISAEWKRMPAGYFYDSISPWPSMLPSHREVAAAHLVPHLPNWTDTEYGQGAALLALAEADGPAGPATATALAYGLATRHQRERSGAVDALLAFCGRGQLPAADLGTALAATVTLESLKLNRITEALGDAARAGAHADVWTTVANALPGLLPAQGARPLAGLADLIALGTQCAELVDARGPIPELAAVAGRGGSSRLVREAARLHRRLTP